MSERSAAEIRVEIAGERQRLADELAELRMEARTTIPIAVVALLALTAATRSSLLTRSAKLLWKLR
jgi:hypothetical protein